VFVVTSFASPFLFIFTHSYLYSFQEPSRKYVDTKIDIKDRSYDQNFNLVGRVGPAAGGFDSTLDITERQYRERTSPIVAGIAENRFGPSAQGPRQESSRFGGATIDGPDREAKVRVTERTSRTTVDPPRHKRDMGYYDDDGHYHSIRRGIQRVAERVAHPIHGPSLFRHHHHHGGESVEREEVSITKEREVDVQEPRHVSYGASYSREEVEPSYSPRAMIPNTITIPCHHIRIGDLLMLQGRPCQVIRITTSAQTGQHRYLGVDLFTKQLHEESSFISNPAPSVIVQNMLGPVFKQYRVLDIREDGSVVSMTEGGDVSINKGFGRYIY
jgi:hypothetical protein